MNTELLHRIESFDLDDVSSDFKFSDRLARENSWSPEFTRRCISEYKKFLFLCAEAGHPMTPSVAVDQVWHLHLCYTRSYWHDLCRDTLGLALHHGPTKGGRMENEKFNQWYQKTLDSYQQLFQTEPPAEIWPLPEMRFSPQDIKNVDYVKHFVISKKATLRGAAALALSLSALGCATVLAETDNSQLGWIIFVSAAVILIAKLLRSGGGNGGGRGGSGGGGWFGCGGCSSGGGGCGGGCGGG